MLAERISEGRRFLELALSAAGDDVLVELHQVRRILEPEATRLATPRLTEHDLENLSSGNAAGTHVAAVVAQGAVDATRASH